jgi:hypothetical protein
MVVILNHKTKCAFCKKMKSRVYWYFGGDIGCKECADKYFESMTSKRG